MGSQNKPSGNMQVLSISVLVLAATALPKKTPHNLPVLFQYEDPSHSVAVFRGAELRQAIAAGLVPGFGNLGRSGKSNDGAAAAANSYPTTPAPPPPTTARYVPPPTKAPYVPPPTTARYVPPPPPVPSQLELAEQACVHACRNLAGQCKKPVLTIGLKYN